MIVLGIESSCDETAAAVVKDGRTVLCQCISSQIDIHKVYGGVVPEIAGRNHLVNIQQVVEKTVSGAGLQPQDIDCVAVTHGAGLVGALLVGVSYAKALAYALNKPLVAVNHILGHIAANYIAFKDLRPPFICLIASGGHTALLEVLSYTEFKTIGSTLDDAVGECFDKVARTLNLEYPGGVKIDKLSQGGNDGIVFSAPKKDNSFTFSYSGLKTAVINYVHKNPDYKLQDICASFTKAAITPLVNKSLRACQQLGYKKLVVAGGVAANSYLRQQLSLFKDIEVYFPPIELCGDNGAMIASQGYYNFLDGQFANLELNAQPGLTI